MGFTDKNGEKPTFFCIFLIIAYIISKIVVSLHGKLM